MKPKKNIKIVLIALLLAGVVAGFGYGMTANAKTLEARVAPTAAVSTGSLMVPGNFSDLAEKVRSGVVNIQVIKVVPEGLEDKAGIEQGDVIMNFDGQQVDDSKDLPRIVASTDVIQSVNRKPVKNADDFVKIVEKARDGGSLLLLVQRGQNTLFAAVTHR